MPQESRLRSAEASKSAAGWRIVKRSTRLCICSVSSKKRKKHLNQPADLIFRYGTHLPVLKSMLEVFQPRGILELGAGKVSTPLFHEYGKKLITIETNAQWVQEVAAALPRRENFTLIHHAVEKITRRSKIDAIPQAIKGACVDYYAKIISENPQLDLLFIDHVSGLHQHLGRPLHEIPLRRLSRCGR